MKLSNKLLITIVILLTIGSFFFFYYKEGTLPINKNDTSTKIFVIEKGESTVDVVKNLSRQGFIRNTLVFYLIIKQKGIEKQIQAGDFRLSASMSAEEIAKALTHGTLDEWITIIEGLRKEEIAQIVSKKLDIPEIEFIQLAPEGYLFPDTYLVPRQAPAEAVIEILTSTFDKKFTDEMENKVRGLGLTKHQAIVLASLVEREARTEKVRVEIASILLRRYEEEIPLQVDATVQYALGYQSREKTWWKKDLTFDDLKINSRYNTYKITGLPPEPIANPSLSSLQAVANADPSTPYLFYLTDSQGRIHYAKTSEEHQKNIEKYLNN